MSSKMPSVNGSTGRSGLMNNSFNGNAFSEELRGDVVTITSDASFSGHAIACLESSSQETLVRRLLADEQNWIA